MAGQTSEKRWDELIGDLYASCLDGDAEARIAPAVSELFNAGNASLWLLNPRTAALAGKIITNIAPENIAAYAAHWHAYDPWTLPLAAEVGERVVLGSEMIEDEALLKHPFYADYGERAGRFHVMGSIVRIGGGVDRVGAIAVQRPRHGGGFNDAEVQLMERLLPHVRRAMQLDERARSEMLPLLAGRASLDALSAAAIVLDGTGVVLQANQTAEALDRAGGVIHLRRAGEDGRISTLRSADTAWLRNAIADAAGGRPGGARRLTDTQSRVYAAVVTPLPGRLVDREGRGWLPGMALLVLRVIDPLTASPQLEEFCMSLFGMTRSEAQAACLLAQGMGPEEIARHRKVQVSTVRTLLMRAMDKGGARNLRQLVSTLAALSN